MILYAGLLILVLMGLLLVLDKNINDKQSLNYFRIIIFLLMIISSLRGSSVGNDTSKYIVSVSYTHLDVYKRQRLDYLVLVLEMK